MVLEYLRNIGFNVLNKEVDNYSSDDNENSESYADLLNHLIKIKLYSADVIAVEVLLPIIQTSFEEKNYTFLKKGLHILYKIDKSICLKQETESLFLVLFDILKKCRCKFLDFDRQKQEIVKDTVDVIEKCCHTSRCLYYTGESIKLEDYDPYVAFYIMELLQDGTDNNLLKYTNPHCNLENHTKTVTYLIGLLASCVKQEWLSIFLHLCYECGIEEAGEFFSDAVIYMCELIKNLINERLNDEGNCLLNALKYCLQNYGFTMKECVNLRLFSLEDDRITKHWRRLLKSIPKKELGCEDEITLANLLFGI